MPAWLNCKTDTYHKVHCCAAQVKAWPLALGTGIRASKVMTGIAELAGLTDVGIKVRAAMSPCFLHLIICLSGKCMCCTAVLRQCVPAQHCVKILYCIELQYCADVFPGWHNKVPQA